MLQVGFEAKAKACKYCLRLMLELRLEAKAGGHKWGWCSSLEAKAAEMLNLGLMKHTPSIIIRLVYPIGHNRVF